MARAGCRAGGYRQQAAVLNLLNLFTVSCRSPEEIERERERERDRDSPNKRGKGRYPCMHYLVGGGSQSCGPGLTGRQGERMPPPRCQKACLSLSLSLSHSLSPRRGTDLTQRISRWIAFRRKGGMFLRRPICQTIPPGRMVEDTSIRDTYPYVWVHDHSSSSALRFSS